MRKSMQECHEMGQHEYRPRPNCPLCREQAVIPPATNTDTRRVQFEALWQRLADFRAKSN